MQAAHEVEEKIAHYKFEGRRQHKTPVTDITGIVELISPPPRTV